MAKPSNSEVLKIIFVTKRLPRTPLGAEYGYLWPLCKQLAQRGHKIAVVCQENKEGNPSPFKANGVTIYYLENPSDKSPFGETPLDRVEQILSEDQYDIIHCVDRSGIDIALKKKKLGVRIFANISAIRLDSIFGLLGLAEATVYSYLTVAFGVGIRFLRSFFGRDRKLLWALDGVFVTTEEQAMILERYYVVSSRRIHVLPYGIEGKSFEIINCRDRVFNELGITPNHKLIVAVCPIDTLQESKILVKAFRKVAIKKPETAMVLVGSASKIKELEFFTLNLALGSKVFLKEKATASEVHDYINACDIFVSLLSRSSGFEQGVLEAMACQKLIIASEVGTSSQLIESGITGYLVRPSDTNGLSQLLLDAVSDKLDTSAIGQKAREKLLNLFDTSKMVDQTIEVYRRNLANSGR